MLSIPETKDEGFLLVTDFSYLPARLRKVDYPRYLSLLLAARESRLPLAALALFDHELAKTRYVVTEAQMARIRLQWWREALEVIYTNPVHTPQHEVLVPLQEAVQHFCLNRAHFDLLLDGADLDCSDWRPRDLASLRAYVQCRDVPLLRLQMEVLCPRDLPEETKAAIEQVCLEVGQGLGLERICRHFLAERQAGRILLPQELLQAAGLSEQKLRDFAPKESLRPVIRQIAEAAETHLAAARTLRVALPRVAHIALLPALAASRSLNRLKRHKYDVTAPRYHQPDSLLPLALSWAYWRRRY